MIGVKGYPASEVMEPILSIAHTYVQRHVLTNIHTCMHAGKLLCAMIDDLTCYIIKMPLDIASVMGKDGMAKNKHQRRD